MWQWCFLCCAVWAWRKDAEGNPTAKNSPILDYIQAYCAVQCSTGARPMLILYDLPPAGLYSCPKMETVSRGWRDQNVSSSDCGCGSPPGSRLGPEFLPMNTDLGWNSHIVKLHWYSGPSKVPYLYLGSTSQWIEPVCALLPEVEGGQMRSLRLSD